MLKCWESDKEAESSRGAPGSQVMNEKLSRSLSKSKSPDKIQWCQIRLLKVL